MLRILRMTALACIALSASAPARDLDGLRSQLASPDAKERQTAVRGLARLGAPEAWELVLDALADPEARVADEAQIVLSGIDDESGLELLLGSDGLASRKDVVAERAAEAVGRLTQRVNQGRLTRALGKLDGEGLEMLLWSLERLAREERLSGDLEGSPYRDVERLHRRGKDPRIRAQALQTMVAFAPELALDAVRTAAQSKDPALRASAAKAAYALPRSVRASFYLELAGDPSYTVRRAVVDELAAISNRAGVVGLIDRLEAETDERLAWSILAHLRRISGLKHGRDPRAWRAWSEELSEDWSGEDSPSPEPLGDATVAFAGMPVLSRRVAFLVDFSGSMWRQGKDGRTRKEAVDDEIRRLLESLPKDTEFNVIPYTATPKPWSKKLVTATRGNVKSAIGAFEKNKMQGKGAFWEAFLVALEDPRVDNVMVLTDGAPTGGRHWNMDLIDELLHQRNRYRGVVLDAILFDTRGRLVGLWEETCAGTGGRCRVIEL